MNCWKNAPPSLRAVLEQAQIFARGPKAVGAVRTAGVVPGDRGEAAGIDDVRDEVVQVREDLARLIARLDIQRETTR